MDDDLANQIQHAYRFALRLASGDVHVAEDIAQEALLRAMRSRESLRDPARLRVWLLRIVANVWKDWCRQQSRRASQTDSSNDSLETADLRGRERDADHDMMVAEEVASSLAAMDQLPDRQKTVLYLVACEQLSLADIARTLGISKQAAKASLSVARLRMRQLCQQK